MDKERALEYWINRHNHAKDYSDIHWDAEERHEYRDYVDAMAWAIKALEQYTEAADVQPVKRGYWKTIMMSEGTGWDLSLTGGRDEVLEYNCSVCGKANILDEFGEDFLPPYCPFCGAKMENA